LRFLIPVFVLLAALAAAASLTSQDPSEAGHDATDVASLVEALHDPAPEFILDVRTPAEFRRGHVPGAVNIPLDTLPDHFGDLEPHRAETIYVICESGYRSARAAAVLHEQGFDAVDVLGGTGAWRRAGLPVE
jgi:rhodanese-related sulfurtransferase